MKIYELVPNDDGTSTEYHYDTGLVIVMRFDDYTGSIYKHCVVGPAVENPDKTKEWWIDGKQLTEEEFNKYLKMKTFW